MIMADKDEALRTFSRPWRSRECPDIDHPTYSQIPRARIPSLTRQIPGKSVSAAQSAEASRTFSPRSLRPS